MSVFNRNEKDAGSNITGGEKPRDAAPVTAAPRMRGPAAVIIASAFLASSKTCTVNALLSPSTMSFLGTPTSKTSAFSPAIGFSIRKF